MNRRATFTILFVLLMTCIIPIGCAESGMLVDSCVAVVSDQFTRWSEGSILSFDDRNILLAVTGYSDWNHDDSPADIYGFWSHDGGRSWTPQEKAVLLQSHQSLKLHNVMSISLIRLFNGDLLMSFFGYRAESEWAGTFVRRSSDRGKTWSEPVLVHPQAVSMPGRMIQLEDGRVILPVSRKGGSAVLWSDDDGRTWKSSNQTREGLEPTVVALKDGRLLMMMRMNKGQIGKAYSSDRGQSWGDVLPTGIPSPASMCTLTRLQNGDLMLIFNPVRNPDEIQGPWPRHRLATMISRDEGLKWSNLRLLDGGDQYADVLKITMASVALIGEDRVIAAWSRSPMQSKEHYRNLYDYRVRVFNLDWLCAGDDQTIYQVPN